MRRYCIITLHDSEMSADLGDGCLTVSSLFDKGLKLYHELCDTMGPSNSPEYQVCKKY